MKANQLTEEEQEFVQLLSADLPAVIARKEVGRFLGGLVTMKTLANADCHGNGLEVAYQVGRNIAYRTDSLVNWLVRTYGVTRLAHLKNL